MLHKFAPQNLITSSGNGGGKDKRSFLLSQVHCLFCCSSSSTSKLRFSPEGPTKESQPANPRALFYSVHLSGSQVVSCLANEPSRRHWEVTEILTVIVLFRSEEAIRQMMWFPRQQVSFLRFSSEATYSSPSQPLFLSAPIPQETLNFQYFWVEQDLSVHQIPSCDCRSDHVAPLIPPDSFVWTRQLMAVVDLSRCPVISATLDLCRDVITNGSKFLVNHITCNPQ